MLRIAEKFTPVPKHLKYASFMLHSRIKYRC